METIEEREEGAKVASQQQQQQARRDEKRRLPHAARVFNASLYPILCLPAAKVKREKKLVQFLHSLSFFPLLSSGQVFSVFSFA